MTTTAAIEADLRDSLVRIRRAWTHEDDPRAGRGSSGARPPGPKTPGGTSFLVRTAITQDVHYWTKVADEEHIAPIEDQLDGADIQAMCSHLVRHAKALSGWAYATRMLDELRQHARALEDLTRPPAERIPLGHCPRERPDGSTCGAMVRASVDAASDVRCPGCRHSDTIEAWQRIMVGSLDPETAPELVARLRGIGIRITERGITQWRWRGVIPNPIGERDGQPTWDVEAVIGALMLREHKRQAG